MDTLKGEKHGSIGLQEALWVVPFPGKFASQTQQVLAINEVTPSSDLASHQAGMQCMGRGHCYCHLAKSIQLSFTKQTTSLTSDRKGSKPAEKRAQLFYWVRTSLQYNTSHKRVESNIDIIYILSRFLNENKGKIILPMSKLNGTLTQIRWETAAAGNTCAACCRLQNRHLGSIWLIMIYFSCNHLFMPLWFIFRGTGLRAKGLGAGVGKHHQSHGILGRTHGHSCPSPTWEWTPVLLPPPHQPIPEDVGCSSHTQEKTLLSSHSLCCAGDMDQAHVQGHPCICCLAYILTKKTPIHEDWSPHLLPKTIHESLLKCSWSTVATCCYIYAQKKQNPGKIQAKQLLRHWEVASCTWKLLHFSHRGSTVFRRALSRCISAAIANSEMEER